MSVRVQIWFPVLSKGSPGHAALIVDGGTPPGVAYLSPYPGSFFSSLPIGWGPRVDFEKNKTPDRTIDLFGMDETTMKKYIDEVQRTRGYSFLGDNCAMQCGECLAMGDPIQRAIFENAPTAGDYCSRSLQLGMKWGVYGTPLNLWSYANALRERFPPGRQDYHVAPPPPPQVKTPPPLVQPPVPVGPKTPPPPTVQTTPSPSPFSNSAWRDYWLKLQLRH